jgi:transcriptional regulator with XRE-family HTH domain
VTEKSDRGAGTGAAPQDAATPFSIGRYLASQRQLRGISLDDLAARTKIPRRNLERLESGAFDAQSDGFVRGFVRTVAEALGLDTRETLMRMTGEPSPDDEQLLFRRRVRIAVVTSIAGALLLLALGVGLRLATRWIVEPTGGPPDHVFRRDAVKSLVDQERERDAGAGSPHEKHKDR